MTIDEKIKEKMWIPAPNLTLQKSSKPRLELKLSNAGLKEQGTIELMHIFESNTSVASLDISRNGIGAGKWDNKNVEWHFAGSESIKRALKANTTLLRLDVSHNR
jgi:NOL1/NOP2/fmu family ribosome biogenesis protein